MKRQVRERVKDSNTTNGYGEGEHFHVAPVAAGLVPNFSYSVAGSAFYDRRVAEAPESPDPNDQVIENVVGGETPSRQPSSSDSIVSNHLNTLLLETLSKSQIDLLNAILTTPPNNPASTPTPFRLTHSLHALLLHLQDRILYAEADLLPQLCTALERKTHTIDVQSAEILKLDNQITQLKATVDFGSNTLTSCWTRDWEMWRTLTGIRAGRRREWWDFRRTRVSEDVDNGQQFSGRELDALVMIAEQNVSVLREDVEDMVEKVEGCKRASATRPVGEEEVEPEEGSWRDV
ncbi:hypothetical protein SNOG_04730 [Parastagonospora nodorum SN15]|uniref:Uncharacterized protein n=1 Tax=Phaeosphaeria nodorum (strain SN15 / ATCC MYA-4574 / FGSC 10173) TaxID=321614 RepID=Q0UU34_PHANO|nr:hypothetical protein SNOG_04730 [Parastagonospora nodorum SN15]EAT88490.2 hypothetical protein SNOG_04730 [Parastagonospora nodorum SN15]